MKNESRLAPVKVLERKKFSGTIVIGDINSGGNNANTPMGMGRWHHLAMTFDGAFIRIYIDGAEAAVSESQASSINSGGSFVIGSVFGQTDADDPNYRQTSHFAGAVDEVRVYSEALTDGEIAWLAGRTMPLHKPL